LGVDYAQAAKAHGAAAIGREELSALVGPSMDQSAGHPARHVDAGLGTRPDEFTCETAHGGIVQEGREKMNGGMSNDECRMTK
jgi:hypothetical protein